MFNLIRSRICAFYNYPVLPPATDAGKVLHRCGAQ